MSVNFYNENADKFFENTVNADMSFTYEIFLKSLPIEENEISSVKNSSDKTSYEILDLGCGSGRDSKFFLEKGFEVTSLDLSPVLAKKASEYLGREVVVGDMRNLSYENRFIGIWACASLLHLNEEEIVETLKRCWVALKREGVLYASFKYGERNYEKDNRTFTCFTEEKFLNLIEKLLENDYFSCSQTFETGDVRSGRESEKWLNVVLIKK